MYILEYWLIMSMKSSVESSFYFRDDIVIFEFQLSISKVTRPLTFYENFIDIYHKLSLLWHIFIAS